MIATSAQFDERLAATYERVGMRPGMLEQLAGVRERRWWPADVTFADAAAMAGAKALAEAGHRPEQVGVMINTSVSREHLEPSTAVAVHHQLGLPTGCLNFDLANACLGFVNAIQLAGTMIDCRPGRLRADRRRRRFAPHPGGDPRPADVAGRDGGRPRVAVRDLDARLRVGRDGAGPVRSPPRRAIGSSAASAGPAPSTTTCASAIWTTMRTDTKKLFEAGLALAMATWRDAAGRLRLGRTIDWFVAHQTSTVHLRAMAAALGVDPQRVPAHRAETYGNIGPAAVPFTLAKTRTAALRRCRSCCSASARG